MIRAISCLFGSLSKKHKQEQFTGYKDHLVAVNLREHLKPMDSFGI